MEWKRTKEWKEMEEGRIGSLNGMAVDNTDGMALWSP